jgi:hypothetical protein
VKAASRVPRRALERLERAAGKLARRVLRGRGGSNVALLPDTAETCCFSSIHDLIKSSSGLFSIAIDPVQW